MAALAIAAPVHGQGTPPTQTAATAPADGEDIVVTGTRVDVGSVLVDAQICEYVEIKPYCVIALSSVGDRAQLGAFAHLRPDSEIEA